jgi:hypothetical protein
MIHRFEQEAQLRANSPSFGTLLPPDQVFNATEDSQRSPFFWPVVAVAPFLLVGGVYYWFRRASGESPLPNNWRALISRKVVDVYLGRRLRIDSGSRASIVRARSMAMPPR